MTSHADLPPMQLAAQAWCTPETSHLPMMPLLAAAFADIIEKERAAAYRAGRLAWLECEASPAYSSNILAEAVRALKATNG